MSAENLTLTPEELVAITGYKQPAAKPCKCWIVALPSKQVPTL